MLNENIRTMRKKKGLTQEEFATRLNVVRQTVSKWEKGLSVPDSDMLIKISELLEVSVGDLLGTKIPDNAEQTDIARQLERVNEQLAIKNKRSKLIIKIIAGVIIGIIALNILLIVLGKHFSFDFNTSQKQDEQQEIVLPADK